MNPYAYRLPRAVRPPLTLRQTLLNRSNDQHYVASRIRLERIHRVVTGTARSPNGQTVTAATHGFNQLQLAVARPTDPMARQAVDTGCDAFEPILAYYNETITRHEAVTASIARVGLLALTREMERHGAPIERVLHVAPISSAVTIPGATSLLTLDAEFSNHLGSSSGQADTLLLRQVDQRTDYAPFLVMEVKLGSLTPGLAECLIAAALLGERSQLDFVLGIETNLREWIFVRVESNRVVVSDVIPLHVDNNNHPHRDANYGNGSLEHIFGIIARLCDTTSDCLQ